MRTKTSSRQNSTRTYMHIPHIDIDVYMRMPMIHHGTNHVRALSHAIGPLSLSLAHNRMAELR